MDTKETPLTQRERETRVYNKDGKREIETRSMSSNHPNCEPKQTRRRERSIHMVCVCVCLLLQIGADDQGSNVITDWRRRRRCLGRPRLIFAGHTHGHALAYQRSIDSSQKEKETSRPGILRLRCVCGQNGPVALDPALIWPAHVVRLVGDKRQKTPNLAISSLSLSLLNQYLGRLFPISWDRV